MAQQNWLTGLTCFEQADDQFFLKHGQKCKYSDTFVSSKNKISYSIFIELVKIHVFIIGDEGLDCGRGSLPLVDDNRLF